MVPTMMMVMMGVLMALMSTEGLAGVEGKDDKE
jgi:hypothetical protein